MKKIFNDIKTKLENGNVNEAYDRFLLICNTLFYNKLMEGFIYEKEEISESLDFFLEINDFKKVTKIVEILNKYYNGYIIEIFEGYVKIEKYEMCSKLKNFIK